MEKLEIPSNEIGARIMGRATLFPQLPWWTLQTDSNLPVHLVRTSEYDTFGPRGVGCLMDVPTVKIALSFEKFLPQWIEHKWPIDELQSRPCFSVYVTPSVFVNSSSQISSGKYTKYDYTILTWGHDSENALNLLAVCCASYFTKDYPHDANKNRAYIDKTESVGLRDDALKKYHCHKDASLTIAMKAAFVEYMGLLGCEVHLWAYPAEVVEVDGSRRIDDLLLSGAGQNRQLTTQNRTQEELMKLYIRGYEHFGIVYQHFQLAIVLPTMADIPIFGDVGSDVKTADFDEACGNGIRDLKVNLTNRFQELANQANDLNKRLEESTLVLKSQYTIFLDKRNESKGSTKLTLSVFNLQSSEGLL